MSLRCLVAEAVATFGGGDKGLHHVRIRIVAVELVQLRLTKSRNRCSPRQKRQDVFEELNLCLAAYSHFLFDAE